MLGMLTHMICDGSTWATWLHLKVRVARAPSSEACEVASAGVACMRCAILKVASSRYSAKPAGKEKTSQGMHGLCYSRYSAQPADKEGKGLIVMLRQPGKHE